MLSSYLTIRVLCADTCIPIKYARVKIKLLTPKTIFTTSLLTEKNGNTPPLLLPNNIFIANTAEVSVSAFLREFHNVHINNIKVHLGVHSVYTIFVSPTPLKKIIISKIKQSESPQ